MSWELVFVPVALLAGLAGGLLIMHLRQRFAQQSAAEIRENTLREAREESDRIRKEAELAAKEEFLRGREELEQKTLDTLAEIKRGEQRLNRREDHLDRKNELITKKEKFIEGLEKTVTQEKQVQEERRRELDELLAEERRTLERITEMNPEEARQVYLQRLEEEMEKEADLFVRRAIGRAKETADDKSRYIIAQAIQRAAGEHTAEHVVSTVDLPDDEIKGRIIGREGRNIRALERATGIDIIVDDTPGVVVVSGFDGARREMARRALTKLIQDGRIHPARIEDVVNQTKREMDREILELGKQAAVEVNLHGLPNRLLTHLGRLKFRTSYGQNVLQHSIEVAHLNGMLAAELRLNVTLAKRCGLLHDIGKALDHEVEGGHPEIGANLAKRLEERPEVVNAIAGHHNDVEPTSLYTVICAAADAISAARPGARRETLEKYIQRLERLEDLAKGFPAVENAFAIQAGREIRVIVNADKIGERQALRTAANIAKEIEQELKYPGEVKVTLIRESRFVEYAR